MKKSIFVLCLSLMFSIMNSQVVADRNPRALVSFNADKTGSTQIDYNTSFMILDYNVSDDAKKTIKEAVLNSDHSIKQFEMSDVNGTSGLYVVVDFFAKDKQELTDKMKFILKEIGVEKVEYNGILVAVKNFSF